MENLDKKNSVKYGEKTFNKLSTIQTLIKKESSLKELCKKHR